MSTLDAMFNESLLLGPFTGEHVPIGELHLTVFDEDKCARVREHACIDVCTRFAVGACTRFAACCTRDMLATKGLVGDR